MEPLLQQAGPWPWRVRDCAWYPDFLQAYPEKDVKICLYQVSVPRHFRVLVEIHGPSATERSSLDPILLENLKKFSALEIVEVPPEEWPFD